MRIFDNQVPTTHKVKSYGQIPFVCDSSRQCRMHVKQRETISELFSEDSETQLSLVIWQNRLIAEIIYPHHKCFHFIFHHVQETPTVNWNCMCCYVSGLIDPNLEHHTVLIIILHKLFHLDFSYVLKRYAWALQTFWMVKATNLKTGAWHCTSISSLFHNMSHLCTSNLQVQYDKPIPTFLAVYNRFVSWSSTL